MATLGSALITLFKVIRADPRKTHPKPQTQFWWIKVIYQLPFFGATKSQKPV